MLPPVSRYATWRHILAGGLIASNSAILILAAGAAWAAATDQFSRS
jgi:hypothetical protein